MFFSLYEGQYLVWCYHNAFGYTLILEVRFTRERKLYFGLVFQFHKVESVVGKQRKLFLGDLNNFENSVHFVIFELGLKLQLAVEDL